MTVPFSVAAFAVLLCGVVLARGETKVVHGDPSKLPRPDPSRQIERKTVEDLQKTFTTRSVPTSTFETRTWSGASPSVPMKAWSGPSSDFYARSIQVGAFDARGTPPSSWSAKGGSFDRGALVTSQSELDKRGTAVTPASIPAEAVELPPDLTEEDARSRFRTTRPLVEVGPTGKKKVRGEATVEREAAPLRVGGTPVGEVRAPPGKLPPQTPAVSK